MPPARLLIVEDEGIVARDLQSRLKALGYTVTGTASTGDEALRKAVETSPDLVLMDIVLKGDMDGIEAAGAIWSRCRIPVVYLTAYGDEATLNRAKVTGPYGYVLKPFSERELRINIEMALYRSQMERKLRGIEQWLAATLEGFGEASIEVGPEGHIRHMNPVAAALTGWKPQEAAGRPVTEVFRLVDRETGSPLPCPVLQALQEGVVVNRSDRSDLVRRDGRALPVDSCAASLRRESDDSPTGAILLFRDTSRLWQVERELRESEERFQGLFENAHDLIHFASMDGALIYANRSWREALGYAAEEIPGLPLLEAVAPERRSEWTAWTERVAAGEEGGQQETEFVSRHGRRLLVEGNRGLVLKDGRPFAMRSIFRDITERRRLETEREELLAKERAARSEAEAASQVKSRFLGLVSHELRNPLNTIRLCVDQVQRRQEAPLSTRQEGVFRRIGAAADRLMEIIGSLLEYSRLQSAQFDVHAVEVDLRDLAGSVVEEIRPQAERKHLALACTPGPELPPLRSDPLLLRLILVNLLDNAIKFCDEGRIEVATGVNERGHFVTVSDTGPGIAPDQHAQIFEPFEHLEPLTHKCTPGVGLGLAIVQEMVAALRGAIELRSQVGAGSEFTVILPRLQS